MPTSILTWSLLIFLTLVLLVSNHESLQNSYTVVILESNFVLLNGVLYTLYKQPLKISWFERSFTVSLILTYRITLVNDAQTICVFPMAIKGRISRVFSVLFKKTHEIKFLFRKQRNDGEKKGRVPLKMFKFTVVLENGGHFS